MFGYVPCPESLEEEDELLKLLASSPMKKNRGHEAASSSGFTPIPPTPEDNPVPPPGCVTPPMTVDEPEETSKDFQEP